MAVIPPDASPTEPPGTETLRKLRGLLLWSGGPQGRGRRYLVLVGLLLCGLWGVIGTYLMIARPGYTSEMTLSVPGSGAGSAINLERIGQASSAVSSPYAGTGISPTAHYRALLMSDRLLRLAAEQQGLSKAAFGKPRITLIDETPLIVITLSGPSPEEVQARLGALSNVLEHELDRLRQDEATQREAGYRDMLREFQDTLSAVRVRILEHQSRSGVVNVEQFSSAVLAIEDLTREMAVTAADADRAAGEAEALAAQLSMSAGEAARLLGLHSDPVFRAALEGWVTAGSALDEATSKWGPNHPKVRAAQAAAGAALGRMKTRASGITGQRLTTFARLLASENGSQQADLLKNLVEASAAKDGLARKVVRLGEGIDDLRDRVTAQTKDVAVLDDLFRDLQVAEAVFRSALARIDTGKTDIFSSYPLTQVFDPPTLPDRPSSPKTMLVLAGGIVGTVFLLIGFGLLWIRQPFLHALLVRQTSKNGSSPAASS